MGAVARDGRGSPAPARRWRRLRRPVGRAALALYRLAGRVKGKGFALLAGGAFAEFGPRTVVQPPLILFGERRIALGGDVWVGPGSCFLALSREPGEPVIRIGAGTSIAGSCVLSAAASIRIGEKVLMARNVYVADHRHAFDEAGRAVLDQGLERIGAVEIDDGAWIGQNVVVGPGVRIGRGAVVGANAVVLDDVPDYSVAVGAPARVVRSLTGAPA